MLIFVQLERTLSTISEISMHALTTARTRASRAKK
uniref:Uncharacterized protein n=1 Tax=Arundo donax TaxID=35708 RepID=A0A0A9BXN9_ARUDO